MTQSQPMGWLLHTCHPAHTWALTPCFDSTYWFRAGYRGKGLIDPPTEGQFDCVANLTLPWVVEENLFLQLL
jgi:hypothetical protein